MIDFRAIAQEERWGKCCMISKRLGRAGALHHNFSKSGPLHEHSEFDERLHSGSFDFRPLTGLGPVMAIFTALKTLGYCQGKA